MPNKFAQKVAASKAAKAASSGKSPRPKVDISDFLDGGNIVESAKADGRLLVLPGDSFIPDPSQPRKTFDDARLQELRLSIETNGQLQPILVGEKLDNGKYPIIAGERRWRAISNSNVVTDVVAIIRGGSVDELNMLLMQIDENERREQVSAIENALAIRRIVDLCVADGKGQVYASELLNISKGQLSKILALVNAPSIVVNLSNDLGVQDVEVLYGLSKAFDKNPDAVTELVEKWESGSLDGNLRQAVKSLSESVKSESPKKNEKTTKKTPHPKTGDVEINATRFDLELSDDGGGVLIFKGAENQNVRLFVEADILSIIKLRFINIE